MCAKTVELEVLSPSKDKKAVLYNFDCVATTDFTTQVSVLDASKEVPISPGNVFTAFPSRGIKRGSWGGPYAEIEWASSSTLIVRYTEGAQIENEETRVNGVTIQYAKLPPIPANPALNTDALQQASSASGRRLAPR